MFHCAVCLSVCLYNSYISHPNKPTRSPYLQFIFFDCRFFVFSRVNSVDGVLHCVSALTVSPEEGSSSVVCSQTERSGYPVFSAISVNFLLKRQSLAYIRNSNNVAVLIPSCCPSPLQRLLHVFIFTPIRRVGRHSSVGIATRYGFDGPGSNLGGGVVLRSRPDRHWGHPASCTLRIGSLFRRFWEHILLRNVCNHVPDCTASQALHIQTCRAIYQCAGAWR